MCITHVEGVNLELAEAGYGEACSVQEACSRCEVWVTMTRAQHRAIVPLLKEDKRRTKGSARGLALCAACPHPPPHPPPGLAKGDRLEPCLEMPDVHAFKVLEDFPAHKRMLFWRVAEESMSTTGTLCSPSRQG